MADNIYSLDNLLRGDRITLRKALEDPQLLKEILDGLRLEEKANLLQASLNKCEDRLLHFALRLGHTDVVRVTMMSLLRHGMTAVYLILSVQNIHGETALHISTQMKNLQALQIMLKSVDPKDRLGLMKIQDKRASNTELYDCGDPSKTLTITSEDPGPCDTALHIAASQGNIDVLECMLSYLNGPGERLQSMAVKNRIGYTALHSAVKEENVECLDHMLLSISPVERAALVSITDIWGSTALHKPTKKTKSDQHWRELKTDSYWEIADPAKRTLLLQIPSVLKTAMNTTFKKAANEVTFQAILQWAVPDVNGKKKSIRIPENLGDIVLIMAFNKRDTGCFRSILHSLDPAVRMQTLLKVRDSWGDTLLHVAVNRQLNSYVKCMVDAVQPETRMSFLSERGKSKDIAMHRAASFNRSDVIVSMLGSVDVVDRIKLLERENALGNTPLNIAVHKESVETLCGILTCLSEIQNDELARLLDGMRVIHCLVKNNKLPAIKSLMMKLDHDQRTALLSQKDRQGKTAIKLTSNAEIKSLFAWLDVQNGGYPLATPPEVLIFYSPDSAPGLVDEIRCLEQGFTQLAIKPAVTANVRDDTILQTIQEVQKKPDVSGVITIIAAESINGYVMSENGAVELEEISRQINNPVLTGKPKVLAAFLVQVRENDNELNITSEKKHGTGDQSEQKTSTNAKSNNNHETKIQNIDASGTSDLPVLSTPQKQPDNMALIACTKETAGKRDKMISLLTKNLIRFSTEGKSLEEVFTETLKTLRVGGELQAVEFVTDLKKRLCLQDVFDPLKKIKSKSGKSKSLSGIFKRK